jgi:hypothetical protein
MDLVVPPIPLDGSQILLLSSEKLVSQHKEGYITAEAGTPL